MSWIRTTVSTKRKYTLAAKPSTQNRGGAKGKVEGVYFLLGETVGENNVESPGHFHYMSVKDVYC